MCVCVCVCGVLCVCVCVCCVCVWGGGIREEGGGRCKMCGEGLRVGGVWGAGAGEVVEGRKGGGGFVNNLHAKTTG